MSFFLWLMLTISGAAQDIHNTVCEGNLARLDSMLQDTDIHVADRRGRSLLHWAVACKQMEVLRYLVDKGMTVNIEDNSGEIPLYVAVLFNNEVFADTLLSLQSSNDWVTRYGTSLLQRAILNKNVSMTQKLVREGIDVNAINSRGSTPLEIAQKSGADEISTWLLENGADASLVRTFEPKGAYMGQTTPGMKKEVFAPNFISTEEYEYGSVFNKAGTEFYYGVATSGYAETRFTELVDGIWTPPVVLLSSDEYGYNDPFLSNDETRLYFISKRAADGIGAKKDHDIWYVEREGDGWSAPINAGPKINTAGNEYYISFDSEGTMYFSSNGQEEVDEENSDHDIYASKYINGEFQTAVNLGEAINTAHYEGDVFVASDASYLVFCATRPDGLGRGDLYVSFRNADGVWSESVNMGPEVNTEGHELCPYVTPDGKYLFYTSQQDIYWIDSRVIESLRTQKRGE